MNQKNFIKFGMIGLIVCLLPLSVWAARLTLTWDPNPPADAVDVYKIERFIGASSNFTQVAVVGSNLTTYIDSLLPLSTNVCYRLRAHNGVGDSLYSNIACATTKGLPVVTGLTVTPLSGPVRLVISWSDAANETGYLVQRGMIVSGATNWTQIASLAPGVTSYTDTNIIQRTTYLVQVCGTTTEDGNGPWAGPVTATTGGVPQPVGNITVIATP